jgi:hypothetical protein
MPGYELQGKLHCLARLSVLYLDVKEVRVSSKKRNWFWRYSRESGNPGIPESYNRLDTRFRA